MTVFTFLASPAALAAACLSAVPYQSVGNLKVGQPAPASLVRETNAPEWGSAEGARVQVGTDGKITRIQRTLKKDECVTIDGQKVNPYAREMDLRKHFSRCELERKFGGNSMQCNGFEILFGKDPVRLDVSAQDLESVKRERAASAASSAVKQAQEKAPAASDGK